MGRIYQREGSATYYGYWTDQRGKAQRRSLRTRDAKVAAARLRELELAATNPAAHSHHTLKVAVDHLLAAAQQDRAEATCGFYVRKAGHLMRVLGPGLELADLTREMMLSYVRQRRIETAGGSTIHKELVTLRRVLVEAKTRKLWIGAIGDIVPTVKVDYKPRKTWLDEHQAKQLLARVADNRRLWAMLAIWGGLCRGELDKLEWTDLDWKQRMIHVRGTKRSSRDRFVPMAPMLHDALSAARGTKRAGLVVGKWSNAIRALHRAAELAQLPADVRKLSPNDLRRTFASLLLNQGVPTIVVAKLLGHASTKMVELVYGQISAKTFRTAVATLPVSDSEWCAAGEQHTGASCLSSETEETSCFGSCSPEVLESFEDLVPRDGVEPPTRGFSVLSELSRSKRLKAS